MLQTLDLSRTLRRLPGPARPSSRAARMREEALAAIERDALAAPAFSYRLLPVLGVRGDRVDVGEAMLDAPLLCSQPGELVAVAAVACTLGPGFPARISELFAARRPSLALALDTVGSELLFRVADRALAAVRRDARRMGLGVGPEASPGDPGIPLDQQSTVLALADAARSGITASREGMLWPVHSLATLVALGRNLPRHSASARCSRCPSAHRCTIRKN